MNSFYQPILADGLANLVALVYLWLGTVIVSGVLSMSALVLAVLRRAASTVRIIGGLACAIGIVPAVLAVSAVFGPGSGPSHSLLQAAFFIVSFLPAVVCAAALLISLKCPPQAKTPQVDQRHLRGLATANGPTSMKLHFTLTVCVSTQALLTGCVVFPHGELVAPPAHGRVLDSDTLEPLSQAKVTRQIIALGQSQVAFTDQQGEFALKADKRLGWLLLVEYPGNQVQYRIEAASYRTFETNLYGGGTLYRGTRPHDLGVVPLKRQ